MNSLYFLIEGGKALDLVKEHIAEKKAVRTAVREMAAELGIEQGVTCRLGGNLLGAIFHGTCHPDFTKPNRKGHSFPKKNTEWEKRFAAAPRHNPVTEVIADAMNIPCTLEYTSGTSHGWRHIGYPLSECGFLYLSENGPYAMWIPDVQAEVSAMEADGYAVAEPAKSFVPAFDGCRRIEKEEWEFLVAQHKLEQKRAAMEQTA
ncbi:hypothetical protein [Paludibacterium paludis]|uniref:Uncharacterized protein n=1 Tax=Paludibacterium paludis TaxID=1225769 RepID=A0A918NX85_9NEIS|nr:hypothetical protein [Paludibacterium paludis]GGY03624.1 hypothetical protein GCM10011289_02450 [Paludibacterium paludis]